MRKVLNILESTSMAHKDGITVQDVYNSTGRPSPQEIQTIFEFLLQDTMNDAYWKLLNLKIEWSLTLEDIVWDIHLVVMGSGLPKMAKMYIILRLSEIE